MQETLDEILTKLNMCSLDGNNLILDNIDCKILLEYINSLQEMKEDLQIHIEDLESEIDNLEDEIDALKIGLED